jgi:DNA polymerase III epsilon subunit-like protein
MIPAIIKAEIITRHNRDGVITNAPRASINCPTNQGKSILPTLALAKNRLVNLPLNGMDWLASVNRVGNRVETPNPKNNVVAHRTVVEDGKAHIIVRLTALIITPVDNITAGENRRATGIPKNRPKVKAAQKADVK